MNIQRFTAATSREALAKAREEAQAKRDAKLKSPASAWREPLVVALPK